MRSLFRQMRERKATAAATQRALLAYRRARDHWRSCEQCRDASLSSASRWCALGLELMRDGMVKHPHWDTCARCQEADGLVRSRQCDAGRNLDDAYRVASQQFAAAGHPNPSGG